MSGRALRITPARRRALLRLYRAGVRGEAVLTAPFPSLLVAYELAEFFHDPSRLLTERIRITPRGRRVVETLVLTKEKP